MSQANALEQLMLDLINAERAAAGVDPLTFDSDLNTSAEDHSTWMLEEDQFSHQGAGGSSPTARMQDAGFEFEGAWRSGENIGWQSERGAPGLEDDVEQIHESLMNSPGHRANILNPDFEEIGIGIERGDFTSGSTFDSVMVTQNFATTDAVDDDDTVGPVAQTDTDTDDTPVDDDGAEPVAEDTPQDPASDGPADAADPDDENERPVDVAETDAPTGEAEEEPVDTTDMDTDRVETPAEDPADDPVDTAETEVPEADDATAEPVEEIVACDLGNGGFLFIDFGELPLNFNAPDTEADDPVEVVMAPSGSEVSDMDGEAATGEFDVDTFLTEISDMLTQIDLDADACGCSEMA
ncbi:CAP domain-containing protein [uncultured Roseobacter sp.]|uniref:CAP domain-containing protein n=1 Tax=uncultured Roseobacter sp. TaxID=114847 RepID=UPI0026328FA9|nr:CAP domain-containing protein [uncultured Roseobacter sp.]